MVLIMSSVMGVALAIYTLNDDVGESAEAAAQPDS
jgi:hypothetical protein